MDLGSLGKAKVIAELTAQDYNVFIELDGKSPFDLVIYKSGVLSRVEVKSTESRNRANTGWQVQIKKVRSNKNKNVITNFCSEQCDTLAIYIKPLDKIIIYKSTEITTKCILTILDSKMEG